MSDLWSPPIGDLPKVDASRRSGVCLTHRGTQDIISKRVGLRPGRTDSPCYGGVALGSLSGAIPTGADLGGPSWLETVELEMTFPMPI